MGSLEHKPTISSATPLEDVECLMWVNALVFTFSSALNSAEVQSFSLDLVFGLYFIFLQNMQRSSSIPDKSPCPASLLVLFPVTVALKSFSGDFALAFFLSVNLDLHYWWYLTTCRVNPLSSTRISNSRWWSWVTAALRKVVHDSMPLHSASLTPVLLHIIQVSAMK